MTNLHIIDHLGLGGAQRVVQGILGKMPDDLLLPLREKGDGPIWIELGDSRFLQKPSRKLLRQLLNLFKVPAQIRKQGIQIVHCHLHFSWLYGLWLYLVIPVRYRPKFIFHEHDSVVIYRWYYPFWVRLLGRKGSFIAVSHFIQGHLLSCGIPQEKIILIKNFVDMERFYPGARCSLSAFGLEPCVAKNTRIVGFAARLVEYKGWRTFLEIARCVPDACYLIAGDGPDAEKLRSEIRAQGLQNRVFCLGYQKNMGEFYRSLDLLIVPSLMEAFGLVQLEAQACGVPVVTYDNQAAVEIFGDGSTRLVPAGDVEMLIQNVEELLQSQVILQHLARKGLENVRSYGLQPYIDALQRVYREVG